MKFRSHRSIPVICSTESRSGKSGLSFAPLSALRGLFVTAKFVVIGAFLALASCSDEIDTPDEMLVWLAEPEHGLVQERTGRSVLWRVKYMPNEYLAWKYLQSVDAYEASTRDSVMKSYDNTICFLLTAAPGEKQGGDVMMQGVGSFEGFQARAMQLNFDVKELVKLRYGGIETPAVISTMENTYGLNEARDIMVIFAMDKAHWRQADTFDLELDDRIFDTGIHHFTFAMEDVRNIPPLDVPAVYQTH